jgi:hypothetical protein
MAWTPEQDDRLRELAADGWSVRRIADDLGKGKSVVAFHGRQLGIDWDRSNVTAAADAARAHNKARRAVLAARMLDEAEYALDLIHEPHIHLLKDGTKVHLDQPDAASHRNYMTSAGIAVDKHLAIERVDTDGGRDQAVSVLERMVDAWGIPRTAAQTDPDDVGVGDLDDEDDE